MKLLPNINSSDSAKSCGWMDELQWGQYVFDPLANYENWRLVEIGTEYKFTPLFM